METLGATIKRKSDSEVESEPKKGKQRRSGIDTVQFLRDYSDMEFQFKREELRKKALIENLTVSLKMKGVNKQKTQFPGFQRYLAGV